MVCVLATNNPGKARELRAFFSCAGETPAPSGKKLFPALCESRFGKSIFPEGAGAAAHGKKGSAGSLRVALVSLAELGLAFTPGEDGGTFVANATQKAVETAAFLKESASRFDENPALRTGAPTVHCPLSAAFCLSDDSGLCIDALDGAPGVDSALFLGADTPFSVRNAHILARLAGVPDGKRTARFVCVAACCLPDGRVLTAEGVLEGTVARAAAGSGGFGYDPIFVPAGCDCTMAQLSTGEKNAISHRGLAMARMKILLEEEALKCGY